MSHQEVDKSLCAYCSQHVGSEQISCPLCGNVYHAFCWSENQGCVNFGCTSLAESETEGIEEPAPEKNKPGRKKPRPAPKSPLMESVPVEENGLSQESASVEQAVVPAEETHLPQSAPSKKPASAAWYALAGFAVLGLILIAYLIGSFQQPRGNQAVNPGDAGGVERDASQSTSAEEVGSARDDFFSEMNRLLAQANTLDQDCRKLAQVINPNLPPVGQAKEMPLELSSARSLVSLVSDFKSEVENVRAPQGYSSLAQRLKGLASRLEGRARAMENGITAAQQGVNFLPAFQSGQTDREQYEVEYPALVDDLARKQ